MAIPGLGSLPGLALSAPISQAPVLAQDRQTSLSAGSEWRFEVPSETNITVRLLPDKTSTDSAVRGTAEIFGTELAPGHTYNFGGMTKAAVFTHHGCTLSITGFCESEYTAEETPMTEYVNLHFALEAMRNASQDASGTTSPRVLVVGPPNSGKTSIVKLLTAYATRSGRSPLVVNLDPGEGMLCIPGSVSAAVMGTGALLDVEDAAGGGWGSSPINGSSVVPVKAPIVYHYGFATPEERPEIYKPLTTRLALAATSRYEADDAVKVSGILVDLAGSAATAKGGYDIISHIVSEFSINVLIVLGSERLYSDMSRRFALVPNPHPSAATPRSAFDELEDPEPLHVLRLPKSGGCVDRDAQALTALRAAQVRKYFFGARAPSLSPHTTELPFDGLAVFRFVDGGQAPGGVDLLPGGADDDGRGADAGPVLERVAPSAVLAGAVLAVKFALATAPADVIRDAAVKGYIYVADVDEARKRVRLLTPAAGKPAPGLACVFGMWPEAVGDLLG